MCEAEYMALIAASQEAVYIQRLFNELMDINYGPVLINCDNQGALALVRNPTIHGRTKHIDIRYHFIRDCVSDGKVELSYIPSESNLADPFTKSLCRVKWGNFRDKLFGNA